uniref:Uncharacterized protein n=1 Tax=Sphaerodactylus townsendi TaxID=933632 RepID=A0ACB8FRW6_9SAUR
MLQFFNILIKACSSNLSEQCLSHIEQGCFEKVLIMYSCVHSKWPHVSRHEREQRQPRKTIPRSRLLKIPTPVAATGREKFEKMRREHQVLPKALGLRPKGGK